VSIVIVSRKNPSLSILNRRFSIVSLGGNLVIKLDKFLFFKYLFCTFNNPAWINAIARMLNDAVAMAIWNIRTVSAAVHSK
jgi:hypothetical protein